MELNLILGEKISTKGKVIIDTFHGDNFIKLYSNNLGIQIPFGKTEEFIQYLNRKYNGNGSVKFSVQDHEVIIPKTKLEKIYCNLREANKIGNTTAKYHREI